METEVNASLTETHPAVASPWHTGLVLAVIAVLAFRGKIQADHMRSIVSPDRITMYERTIFFQWLVFGLVLLGVWLKGASVLTILGEHWRSAQQFFRDLGLGVAFLIASIAITSILGSHGESGDKATQFLLPQGRAEVALWLLLSLTAGICEEAIYRGYLQKQFTALTKNVPTGIILSALTFGAAHSYQGLARASLIAVFGAMGGILAYWCRSVRPGMIAHVLQDTLGGLIPH